MRFFPPIAKLVGAGLIVLLIVWLASSLIGGKRAETEARLGRNQAGAAVQSGADAVNTVGKAEVGAARSGRLTAENERKIRDAEGANVPVLAPAQNAGLQALCRRRVYADDPRCVRLRAADPVQQ